MQTPKSASFTLIPIEEFVAKHGEKQVIRNSYYKYTCVGTGLMTSIIPFYEHVNQKLLDSCNMLIPSLDDPAGHIKFMLAGDLVLMSMSSMPLSQCASRSYKLKDVYTSWENVPTRVCLVDDPNVAEIVENIVLYESLLAKLLNYAAIMLPMYLQFISKESWPVGLTDIDDYDEKYMSISFTAMVRYLYFRYTVGDCRLEINPGYWNLFPSSSQAKTTLMSVINDIEELLKPYGLLGLLDLGDDNAFLYV